MPSSFRAGYPLRTGSKATSTVGDPGQPSGKRPTRAARTVPCPPSGYSGDMVDQGELSTHSMSLDDGPKGYRMFEEKEDGCVCAVFRS
ncbi:hypothetical protein GCM10017788_64360 [Amycolatopsis acidiphila]|nr:hypothetical protein GCM10017788_64360 [Amycolatopsis acidiphila]